jgi:glutaminyl-peptide cyclotransferase
MNFPDRHLPDRRMKQGPAVVLLVGILTAGCFEPASRPDVRKDPLLQVDGDRALAEVEELLRLGPREAGTEGAARAAAHLRDRLTAAGVEARIDEFIEDTPTGPLRFRNVIGRLPGRGKGRIVIGSHFDTQRGLPAGFQGANDSGSSSGLLLELARVLASGPVPEREIWFVFFDGEECQVNYGVKDGLHGSRKLARDLSAGGRAPETRAVLILDMVGDRDLSITLPRNVSPPLLSLVFEAAREENIRAAFTLSNHAILDDHVPFLEQGIPAIVLIDFLYGPGSVNNAYWHTAEDTFDKLSAESLGRVGRVTLRTVRRLSDDP